MKKIGNVGAQWAAIPLIAAASLAAMPGAALGQSLDVVEVTGGSVQGVPSDIEGVTQFLGVPYAGNVGGENRWKEAPPVEPWEGVRLADTWGDQILQDPNNLSDAAISDNGLNVAVWTPAKSADEKLPVYMLVHGGANRLTVSAARRP